MKDPKSISLESVREGPLAFAFDLDFSVKALAREPLLEISPVRLEGEVAPIEGGFSLNGRVAYSGKLECSRCLEPYPFDTRDEFSLVLYKRPAANPEELSLKDEDLDVSFYDEPDLAVAPLVEERIQIAVPMKPLCREDCRGLCPRCGHDRNQSECGCEEQSMDPRWEALKKLKKA